MKSYVGGIVLILILLAMPAVSDAALVKQVQVTQAVGAYAHYDAATGTITWTGGAGGWLMTDAFDVVTFDDGAVTASFTGITDLSSGNLADALFSSGTWSLTFTGSGWLQPVFTMSGHVVNNYRETETGVQTNKLDGRAFVVVDAAVFTLGFFDAWFGVPVSMEWEGGLGTLAGLIADVTLPDLDPGITDYQSDYDSTNLIITLWADEGVVPEPATMMLFGLGSLLIFRRKRKA